jgi:hypothetical protein
MTVGKAPSQASLVRTIAAEIGKPSPLNELAAQAKAGTAAKDVSTLGEVAKASDIVERITTSPFQSYLKASMSPEDRDQWKQLEQVGAQLKTMLGAEGDFTQILAEMKADPMGKAMLGQIDQALNAQLAPELGKIFATSVEKSEERLATHDYDASARALATDLGIALSDASVKKVGNLIKEESKRTIESIKDVVKNIDNVGAGALLQALFGEVTDTLDKLARIKTAIG